MAQSSCEVVRRAIEFRRPDRLPLLTPEQSDIAWVNWNQIGPGDRGQKETYDEWGCLWSRDGADSMGRVKKHPLADWQALDYYRWPDPDDPVFYAGMEEEFKGTEGQYINTAIFMLLFERMWALHGFENTLADLYLERERIEMLADRIVEFDLGLIHNISQRFPGQIHGLKFSEDWGTQQALMINPALWREFFKPRYIRIFDAIHQAGWHVWMHTDGRINAILEDLIEIGINVIEIEQPHAIGIEEVGQQFRGRICFETLCDIQMTLPTRDLDKIRAEAHTLLEHWATPQGGLILSIDGENNEDLGFSPDIVQAMLDAFLEAAPWQPRQTPELTVTG